MLFLPEGMKIEKFQNYVTNLHDQTEYVIYIKNLKQALNHGLILKKGHRVIKFCQKVWLRPCIDTNTKLSQKAKNSFEKYFLKLINNAVFRKTTEDVRKQKYQTCNDRKEKKSFSIRTKLSCHNVFHRKFISNRNEKNSNINKQACFLRLINIRSK